jgi:hypothetical protein
MDESPGCFWGCIVTVLVLALISRFLFGGSFWGLSRYWPFSYLFDDPFWAEPYYGPFLGWWWKKKEKTRIKRPLLYPPGVEADPDFSDEKLDRLIEDGDLSEAREYLRQMLKIARETKDKQGEANYRIYREKLQAANLESAPPQRMEPPGPEEDEDDATMEFLP